MNLLLRKISLFKKLERTKNSIVWIDIFKNIYSSFAIGRFSDVIPNGKFTLAEISCSSLFNICFAYLNFFFSIVNTFFFATSRRYLQVMAFNNKS